MRRKAPSYAQDHAEHHRKRAFGKTETNDRPLLFQTDEYPRDSGNAGRKPFHRVADDLPRQKKYYGKNEILYMI